MTKRLIDTLTGKTHTVKMHYDSDYAEYTISVWMVVTGGALKQLPKCDAFETDKTSAFATARAMYELASRTP